MAVREYIGARYVPVFGYVDEQGITQYDWTDTVSYEPLVVMQNQGDSYISKQPVPIGVDITNQDYWLLAYNFNAQYAQILQQLNEQRIDIAQNESDIATLNVWKPTVDSALSNDAQNIQTNADNIATLGDIKIDKDGTNQVLLANLAQNVLDYIGNVDNINNGVLNVENGGTGTNTIQGILDNLGIESHIVGSSFNFTGNQWSWIRLDNNLGICWKQNAVAGTFSQSGAIGYELSTPIIAQSQYPFNFNVLPVLFYGVTAGSWAYTPLAQVSGLDQKTYCPKITAGASTTLSGLTYSVDGFLLAIGTIQD